MKFPKSILLLVLVGCIDPGDVDALRQNQEHIQNRLKKLETRLEARARAPAAKAPDASAKVHPFAIGGSPQLGPSDAWVTIVEVSDFQCPFCKRATPTLKKLLKRYGRDVRLVFKHNPLPFHKRALPAAIAAECAHDQGRFWPMHDQLFDNIRALEDDDLQRYAERADLDLVLWQTCVRAERPKQRILKSQRTANDLGARGTPSFFINGRNLKGAQPEAAFALLIDEELEKAKKSGIPRSAYYERAVMTKR